MCEISEVLLTINIGHGVKNEDEDSEPERQVLFRAMAWDGLGDQIVSRTDKVVQLRVPLMLVADRRTVPIWKPVVPLDLFCRDKEKEIYEVERITVRVGDLLLL